MKKNVITVQFPLDLRPEGIRNDLLDGTFHQLNISSGVTFFVNGIQFWFLEGFDSNRRTYVSALFVRENGRLVKLPLTNYNDILPYLENSTELTRGDLNALFPNGTVINATEISDFYTYLTNRATKPKDALNKPLPMQVAQGIQKPPNPPVKIKPAVPPTYLYHEKEKPIPYDEERQIHVMHVYIDPDKRKYILVTAARTIALPNPNKTVDYLPIKNEEGREKHDRFYDGSGYRLLNDREFDWISSAFYVDVINVNQVDIINSSGINYVELPAYRDNGFGYDNIVYLGGTPENFVQINEEEHSFFRRYYSINYQLMKDDQETFTDNSFTI